MSTSEGFQYDLEVVDLGGGPGEYRLLAEELVSCTVQTLLIESTSGKYLIAPNPAVDSVSVVRTSDRPLLRVGKSGDGAGFIRSSPTGIRCGEACAAMYDVGTRVGLLPLPAYGSEFVSWSGHGDCLDGEVTMDLSKTCSASFDVCSIASIVNLPAQDVSGDGLFDACNELRAGLRGVQNPLERECNVPGW